MEFGLCAPLEDAGLVRDLGFSYIEVNAAQIGQMSGEAFAAALARSKALGFPVKRANCLFPGELRLCGPDMRPDAVAAWLRKVMPRLAALGVEKAVFGSGGARKRPEGLPYPAAFRDLVRVCRMIGGAAEASGLTVVIEPLNTRETDMINSLAEGAALMAAADHPCVGLLADAYHLAMEGEHPSEIARVGGVGHVHVALKEGRRWPVAEDAALREFFLGLRAAGYDGCVSVEGNSGDRAADAPAALAALRRLEGAGIA